MRPRPLSSLLAAAAVAGSLAMAPALPSTEPLEQESSDNQTAESESEAETGTEPVLNEPCDEIDGATTITPDAGFDDTVPTPVGAANMTDAEDAGLYQLDLAGLEVGSTARVRMTLSWDNPVLADYDLVVNGNNAASVDDPETHSRTLDHCDLLDLETMVFFGLPVDTLNLQVEVTDVVAPPPAPEPTAG